MRIIMFQRIVVATTAAVCAIGIAAPSAVAATESLKNDWLSEASIVGSDACSVRAQTSTGRGTLTGNRVNIPRSGYTEKYDKGYFVPSGFTGRIYQGSTWKYSVPGPWTECNQLGNVKVYVFRP